MKTDFIASQQDKSLPGYYVEVDYVRRVAQSLKIALFDRRIPDYASVDAMIKNFARSSDSPIVAYRPATATQKLCLVIQVRKTSSNIITYSDGFDERCFAEIWLSSARM